MSLSPMPGDYIRVYYGFDAPQDYSSEPMEEVDLSDAKWGSHAAHSVWRVTDVDKRIMDDSAVPVIKVDGSPVTPSEIWYGAGYVVFSPALSGGETVIVYTGKYLTPTEFFGCATRSFTDKTIMKEVTCDSDTAVMRFPTIDDWDGKIEAFKARKRAEATSTGGASHSHLKAVHMAGGTDGNGPTFDLQDNNDLAVTIVVVSDDITVGLKTDGANPTGTALETLDALNKDADVIALGIQSQLPAGENGSGVVADSGPYTLAGGLDTIDFAALKGGRACFRFYGDYANGDMHIGFGYISDIDWIGGPADLLKAGMTIQGSGYQLRHVVETP